MRELDNPGQVSPDRPYHGITFAQKIFHTDLALELMEKCISISVVYHNLQTLKHSTCKTGSVPPYVVSTLTLTSESWKKSGIWKILP